MAVYKDKNGTWYVSARYTNWKGEADRKVKRGFQTKREAAEWEKNFFLENAGNLDMTFEAFYQLYKQNTKDRIKLNTWKMKESVIEGKILPYFRSRRMNEIKPRDVVNWQNTMMKMTDENGKPFSPVYLKTIHNQLSAIFNHAVKFYDLPSNPAQKAGITTAQKGMYLPSHIFLGERYGLDRPSTVMLEQLRTVNQDDLGPYIGTVEDHTTLNAISKALKKTYGLWFYQAPKDDVRCLCRRCLDEYRDSNEYIISRRDPFQKEKEPCDRCRHPGYDYVLKPRRKN